MKLTMNYLKYRLTEPSTWRGLTVLLTFFGVTLSPELQEAIVAAGVAVYSLILILKRDASSPDANRAAAGPAPGGMPLSTLTHLLLVVGFGVGLCLGCAKLKPGADPVLVRAEQVQQVAESAFDMVLRIDHKNRNFWQTNAPAFHQFCEWLRQPQPVVWKGASVQHPRAVVLQMNLDNVKLAYQQGRATSNAVLAVMAPLESAFQQAQGWLWATGATNTLTPLR